MANLTYAPEIVLITAGRAGPLEALDVEKVSLPGCKRLPALMTVGNMEIPLIARRHKLDLIHDTSGVTPFLLGGGGAKMVVTVHDVIPLSFPNVSTRLDTLIYRHWLPHVLPRVDAVITDSSCSRRDIEKYLKIQDSRVHEVPLGANDTFRPATTDHILQVRARHEIAGNYILYVGSVEERKNLLRVLQAYASLGDTHHKLVIVGARKWRYKQIADTFSELNLASNVLFTGHIDEDDLPALYSGADLFVFPSLYEGFGLPVLEAMSCGTPVITSNMSSLPEVAGDAAIMVDPYDVRAIASAIHCVLASSDLRTSLRQKGLVRASSYSWERTAQMTVEVYERLKN
jgi:glycosyltransferase involved in cell wall biosynthesis